MHVRFHDSSSSSTKIAIRCFDILGGVGHRLTRVGFCGAVNIGYDEDLELRL